jgi:dephospho-CoA kinase
MSSAQQPILVGITGGAATGKSSVAKKLAPLLPAEVFNSDARVHDHAPGHPN